MKIKFYPFVQTMIEQSEEIEILNNLLIYKRIYGPEIINDEYILDDELVNLFNKIVVKENELIDFQDVIEINNIKFNFVNSSKEFQELCLLVTNKINFKYNPRAFKNEEVLFYLGDFKNQYRFGLYEEAENIINKQRIILKENKIFVDKEQIEIYIDKYKIKGFNTTNELYQVIITSLLYKKDFLL